jgi:hypothetical protein
MITAGDIQIEPDQAKVSWMTPSIVILISGDISLQTEILNRVHDEVEARNDHPANPLAVSDLADLYVEQFTKVRKKRAENAILAPLGFTYANLSESMATQLASELWNFELPRVSAIVAGHDSTGGHLWLIDQGAFRHLEAICCDGSGHVSIGIGHNHAQSQMLFARHTRHKPFAETLFLTYLAKKRAEVAPGVGSGTDMFALRGIDRTQMFGPDTTEQLEVIYQGVKKQEAAAFRRAGVKATKYAAEIGLVGVKLSKDYGAHKAGAIIKVDPGRAEWLRENGYEAVRKKGD